jgi:hypothetical protein
VLDPVIAKVDLVVKCVIYFSIDLRYEGGVVNICEAREVA